SAWYECSRMRLRSNVSVDPSQMNRSTRLPRRGTCEISAVSSPNMESQSAPAAGPRHVQQRYTKPLFAKSGCSAMPSRPRSEAELTARSSTTPCSAPFTTRLTWPVLFSSTRKSFGPRNAMPVGWVRPDTTVRTERFGSSIRGPVSCGSTTVVAAAELFLRSGSGELPETVALLLISPTACGVTTSVIAAPPPTANGPRLQLIVVVPLQVP